MLDVQLANLGPAMSAAAPAVAGAAPIPAGGQRGGGGAGIADTTIHLKLQGPDGNEQDISFRLGDQRQMLIDVGQSASARGVFG